MVIFNKNVRHAWLASLVGCVSFMAAASQVMADETLTIGSTAPALDIEHWVHDGHGKFKPVTEFEKGKVYVVEFWATWCGPCVASMPHLVEIQNKFAKKDVQVVSISNEDLATVEKFLEKEFKAAATTPKEADEEDSDQKSSDEKAAKASGDTPKTYGELTSAYCLTTDPDGSSDKSYMEAAGQNGIPCAFIVGKDQKIEWIGHPMSMDEVLTKVVEGKWDREAFGEEFKESQQMDLLMAKVMRSARGGKMDEALATVQEVIASTKSDSIKQRMQMMRVQILAQSGQADEAIAAIDDLVASAKDAGGKQQLQMMKVQLLMRDTSNPKLAEVVTQAFQDFKDEPQLINVVAWGLYESFQDGLRKDKALLKATRMAAEKAAAAADEASQAAILDTAAHLQFLDGDTATALKTQEQAVKLASGELKDTIVAYYEELKKAEK